MGPKKIIVSRELIKPKKNYKVMNLEQKLDIIDRLASGETPITVGQIYGVNESTIRSIKRNEEKIRQSIEFGDPSVFKTAKQVLKIDINKMENELSHVLYDLYMKGVKLNQSLVKEKAMEIYNEQNKDESIIISPTDKKHSPPFRASTAWYYRYMKESGFNDIKKRSKNDDVPETESPPKRRRISKEESIKRETEFLEKLKENLKNINESLEWIHCNDPHVNRAEQIVSDCKDLLSPYNVVVKNLTARKMKRLLEAQESQTDIEDATVTTIVIGPTSYV